MCNSLTLHVKLLHSMAEHKTLAGCGEVDYVYTSLMLVAQRQLQLKDGNTLMSNF